MKQFTKSIAILGAIAFFLWGCSSSTNSLLMDASQPVYFGSLPKFPTSTDSAGVEFVETFSGTTSHLAEKGKTIRSEHSSITVNATEQRQGDLVFHVANALAGDPETFIGDVSMIAEVETYVPWDVILSEVLALLFFSKSESSGMGEATREMIELHGKVFRVWKVKR